MSLNTMVYEDLYQKIKTGFYKEGELLPTEIEMERIYAVSRAPIRQALSKLANEGLVMRQAGKGTFVCWVKNLAYSKMSGFGQEFLEKGDRINCITLCAQEIATPEEVRAKTQNAFANCLYLERVRNYNGKPIQLLKHYVSCLGIAQIVAEGDFHSLREIYDKNGVNITGATETIEAIVSYGELSKKLAIADGTPLLYIERITYYDERKIAEYLDFYILTNDWKYRTKYGKSGLLTTK